MPTKGKTFKSLLHDSVISVRFCRLTEAWQRLCTERSRVCPLNDGLERACLGPRSTLGQVMERLSLVSFIYKKRTPWLFCHGMATSIKSAKVSVALCNWKTVTASGSVDWVGVPPVPVLMFSVYVSPLEPEN